jgi:hypothetical protein
MTTEQQKNRCNTLIVQEDGSILYKGNVFLILENKRKAEYVKKAIKALHDLKYDK